MTGAIYRRLWRSLGVGTLAPGVLLALPGLAASADEVTFAKDVAPILQEKCQVCHRPGSIGPMSLLTYEEARPWATAIKRRVTARTMPPWHLDTTVGIKEFKNDRSLSDEQIGTIVRWVDAGTPLGDPTDLPPLKQFPEGDMWRLAELFGPPDLIVKSEPYTLAAVTQDKWWKPLVETGLTEPRWVRAIEIKPSYPNGRRIVHHALARLVQEEDGVTNLASSLSADDDQGPGLFMEWAVGKAGEIFPEDAGKLMLPGAKIRWDIHYHAVGEEIPDDVVELGVYFYPKGQEPKYRTILHALGATQRPRRLDIPPGEIAMTRGHHVLKAPARLENYQPHMHMRGKAMSMEAILPDGSTRILSHVNNFQWNWHVNYVYADGAQPVLPKGTILAVTAWHDNTKENPNNPDWRQWVGNGGRTVDEMAHAWVDVTYISEEDYEKEVAKRKAKETTESQ